MLGFIGICVQNLNLQLKFEVKIFAYLKYLLCSKKVNVMGKGKNWSYLQKFEIYRNVELHHQSHTGDDSSI